MLFRSSKRSKKRQISILLLEIVVFLIVYLAVRGWVQRDLITGPAPVIRAVETSGEQVSLNEFRGQPVLLHFWASWCKICRFEQGAITSVADDWPVLTIAMESGDDEQLAYFMRKHQLSWRTINDESGAISDGYGVVGVPTSFVIDSAGEIRFRESGYTTALGLKLRLWLARLF